MSLLRSERMGFYNLIMPKESAIDILDALGSVSMLQFIDPEGGESSFKRDYSLWVKRCEEISVKLGLIYREMRKYGKDVVKTEDYKGFLEYMSQEIREKNVSHLIYFDRIEQEIEQKMNYMNDQIKKFDEINTKRNNLLANRVVLCKAKSVLLGSKFTMSQDFKIAETPKSRRAPNMNLEIEMGELRPVEISNIHLSYMIGTVPKEEILRFKRMLFRVTKGNIFNICEDISLNELPPENREGETANLSILKKAFYIIIYQAGESGALTAKLAKICESFGATKFDMPKSLDSFNRRLEEIDAAISDTENLYNLTKIGIETCFDNFSELNNGKFCSVLEEYRMYVAKEKSLFQNMNLLREKNHIYHGYCWVPMIYEEQVMTILQNISKNNKNIVTGQLQESNLGSLMKPPTFFRTNEFTGVFQEIVNTYGMPRYREINPGLFNIVLFPFLFGVMFGDIGHGFIVFIFGCYLMFFKEKIVKENSPMKTLLPARYLLTLMGFFACFCGFIYNDMMSLTFDFGSCYNLVYDGSAYSATRKEECYYPFGVDPVWSVCDNELTFYNSLKMKLAVIIGVLQMLFGIVLKGLNHINDRKPLDFFFEFIPQFLLLAGLFGYMDLLIVLKWLTDWTVVGVSNAPSIITIMIDIPLKLGQLEGEAIWGDDDEEADAQEMLLFVIAACAVVMLVMKPTIIAISASLSSNRKPEGHKYQGFIEEDDDEPQPQHSDVPLKIPNHLKNIDEHEHSSMGELFIYQSIETIEFVLGSISNTASYLRLWALSLAHSQLSSVFFEKIMEDYIEDGDVLMMIVTFFIFANVSFAVLMCMDSMECFLHALRLQCFRNSNNNMSSLSFFPFCNDLNLITLAFKNPYYEVEYRSRMATNNLKNTKIQLGFIAIFTVPSFIIEAIFTNSMIVSLIKMFGISGILLILFLVLPKLKKILIYIMLLLNFALIFFLFYEMDVLPEIYEMESICDYIFLYMFIFLSYQQLAFTLPWTFQAFSIVGGFLYLLLKLKSFELNGSFCIILFIMWFSIINLYLREKGDRERFYELQAATSLVDKYQYLLKEVDPGINILLKQTREKGTKQGKRLFSSFVKEKIKNKSPEKKLFDIEYINSWAQSHYRLNSLAKVMDFFEQIYITENPDAEKEASNISKNIKGYLEEIINPFNNMQMGFDCSPTKQFLCVKKEMCESHVKEKQFSVIFCVYEWKSDIYILVRLNDFHLEEEVEKLKELDRFKDQLLANITHDLRTPLNGMIYFIKQAKEVKLDDNELNKLLNYAEINGNLLMNLIGDILDRSLLKANKMRLNVQKFCLKPVLDEIMILLQPKAEFQSIKLNLLYLCREELIVESDSDRLKQVLINLVSNAIKFTKKGFVRLRVYKKSERFLYFEVIDTGIGISKDDIRRLGTPFNSYDTHGVNGRGIGLGLSISKEIIGKLGPSAHLHISSKMGLGSKFAFKIYRSLVLKESVGAQKRKSLIKSFQKNEFKFTFEKLSIRNQNTDLSGDIEFSENNINEPMGRIDEEFSEVDSTDLQIESQISMNFDSEAIDEKIKKNEDLSPFKVKTFFDKKPKKQTMLQLNNTKSPKKDIRNIPPQKKLMNLINERGSPLKILIVDDNLFNILIMEKYLKKLSFDKENSKIINEFAHNGEIAVEKFKLTNKPSSESYFSLIIMDCEMPIMNGFEASTLIVKLIEEEKYRKCEILAYSALNLDSEVNKCKEHGMRYFLCKPCTENELFGTMYRALKTAEAEEETGDNLQILKQTSLAGGL